jgi:osmotically-inducible protein OsmY
VDDAATPAKVKAAIFNDPTLKSAEINVETFKGVVQLSGFVNSKGDIDQAIQVARAATGVVCPSRTTCGLSERQVSRRLRMISG